MSFKNVGLKGVTSLAISAVLCALLAMDLAMAQECIGHNGVVLERRDGCVGLRAGGGDVPVPFGMNSRVELADGELYMLLGRVRILPRTAGSRAPRVYFEVDLHSHSWLDSKKRRMNPRYPIDGTPEQWQQYDGQRVKFSCRAIGRILQLDGAPQYVIFLQGVQPAGNERR